MNIRQFVKTHRDGTYSVSWDAMGNPNFVMEEFGYGYMVATDDSLVISGDESLTIDALWDWITQVEVNMGLELFYLGVWTDPNSGEIYFDVSMLVTSGLTVALQMGRVNNQIAIWDNKKREAINVG